MKKHIALLLLALAVAFGARAQDYSEFMYSEGGRFSCDNILESGDGHLLIATCIYDFDYVEIGEGIYKFTKNGEFIDSLFIANTEISTRFLFEHDPEQKGIHLFGDIYYKDGKSYFRLLKFDDDLNVISRTDTEIFDGPTKSERFHLLYNKITTGY